MKDNLYFETFIRDRITELRKQRRLSEYGLSLALGKSGSYIRLITNGRSMPSVKELFNILQFFGVTASEFFYGLEPEHPIRAAVIEKIRNLPDEDLKKILLFISWIQK